MAKTLADMTAEERANCVGMWAEMRSIWGIILGYEGKYVKLLCPTPERVRSDRELVVHVHIDLTRLLPDLPRAWTPDGEPVDGAWEYGVEYKYLTNRGAEWRLDADTGWYETYRSAEQAASASVQSRIVCRRVSPPEVINE